MDTLTPAQPVAYNADFYGWAMAQAQLLRADRLEAADILNTRKKSKALAAAKSAS